VDALPHEHSNLEVDTLTDSMKVARWEIRLRYVGRHVRRMWLYVTFALCNEPSVLPSVRPSVCLSSVYKPQFLGKHHSLEHLPKSVPYINLLTYLLTYLRYRSLMAWAVRLFVCLSSICRLWRCYALPRGIDIFGVFTTI